jgi:transaldolase
MKFFLDTANLDELKKATAWGIIDGVTTNPSLIAREGVPVGDQIRRICDIVDGDISAEVLANEANQMVREGRELAKIHKNVVIKVPLTRDGITACSALSKDGYKVNVTLCSSAGQMMAASLRTPNHVIDAALAAAHVGPAPFKVYDSNHPLTDKGLDQFLQDHRKAFEEVTVAV